jgi:hypothetical protein
MPCHSKIFLKPIDAWLKGVAAMLLSFILGFTPPLWAQEKPHQADSSSHPAEEATSTWTLGASYSNNSSFLGRNQPTRLPFLSSDLTYKSKRGIWVSAMVYQILDTPAFIDEVDLMAGWDFQVTKRLDGSLSYSRFFFSPESPLLKAATANSFSAQAGLDWQYVYSRLNFSYIFGGTSDLFLILDNSRYFQIDQVLHPEGYLSVEPKVSIIAGTQTFVETHIETRKSTPAPAPASRPGGGKPGSAAGGGGATTNPSYSSTTSFNVLNYEVSAPVTYTFKNLSLDVALRYSIPVNLLEGDASKPRFFCTTSLYYTIR